MTKDDLANSLMNVWQIKTKNEAEILGVLTDIRFNLKEINLRLEALERQDKANVRVAIKREMRNILLPKEGETNA